MINRARLISMQVAAWLKANDRERGASMVEYAMLVSLIALVAFIAVMTMGQTLSDEYSMISDSVINAGP